MINSIIELILLPILLPISIIWVCYKNSNNKDSNNDKDSNKLDNLSNKEENNNNISISNETKICDSSKVKRTYESNRNTDYIHVVNQYDTVMFTYDDMKKEYQKIYYGDHNSAKLNNLIVNDIKNNPIKDKKIKEVNQIYEFTYLTLYLNKSNQELIKDDQINYQLLGINKLSAPYLLIDEDYTNNLYIKFIYEDTTSKDYSNTIFKLLEYCHNDTYFTLGYSEESYKYKFLYNNNQVNLENYNIDNFNNDILTIKDNFLKNYNIISRYLFYVGFENYDEIPYNIQPDIHYEDIVEIFNKFKNNEQFKITDLPYLNEINDILSYISTKIINVFNLQNPLSLIKIDSKKKRFNQELHQTYSLRIYLSNTYRFLINEKDELDYNKLGIDKLDLNLYLDDEEARFIICVDDTSNKNFSKLLLVLFKYCQDEMFAIYGYEDIDTYYKYKFVFCNSCVKFYD